MENNITPKKTHIDQDAQMLTDIITEEWENNRKKKVTINARRKKKKRMGE